MKGQSVQLNVIITPDQANADKLMTKLRTMKGEVALLRKDLIVYEFVGKNDVLPLIAEGRKHLESKWAPQVGEVLQAHEARSVRARP